MNQLDLFASPELPPRPAPVVKTQFTGPYERRALVVTQSFARWCAWREAHATEYGSAVWLINHTATPQYTLSAFVLVELDT